MSEEKKEKNIEELKKQLEDCQKLKEEYLADWQRERADFLNYKKEEMERIEGFLKYAGTEFILKILPILDNFDITEKKLPENLKADENIRGILQIKEQILDFLKNLGIEPIDCLGKKFDPNFMEVVEEVEVKNKESGIIGDEAKASSSLSPAKADSVIEEIQKGYKIQGKLLRPAKVRVTK